MWQRDSKAPLGLQAILTLWMRSRFHAEAERSGWQAARSHSRAKQRLLPQDLHVWNCSASDTCLQLGKPARGIPL